MRELRFHPRPRDPPRKTKRLNKRGRTLTITTELLIRGSCNISQPFGDPAKMARYLTEGRHTQLRRRLEADLKSLHAMYQYGRLHGALRLRWGFLDEPLPVPWVHRNEPMLYDLKRESLTTARSLEVVQGSAPRLGRPLVPSAASACRRRPPRVGPVELHAA